MSIVGIEEIGCCRPENTLDVFELGENFDADPEFIRSKLGFEKLCRKDSDQETSDLCVQAFEQLQNKVSVDPAALECLIVVTQNPDGAGLPHTSTARNG